MVTVEDVNEKLKLVEDPELELDIFTLGLVYNVDIVSDTQCDIRMTFTSPQCPFGPYIVEDVKKKVGELFETVNVEVVFSPRWEPSEELKAALGVGGMD